jgi:hypothetical protein
MRLFLTLCVALGLGCGGSEDAVVTTDDTGSATDDTGSATTDSSAVTDSAMAADTTMMTTDAPVTTDAPKTDAPVTTDAPVKSDALPADATPGKCDMIDCPMGKKCCASSGECVPTPPPPGC